MAAGGRSGPAFVRRFGDEESLFRTGMLPEGIYCGERPPTLQDYHDEVVADDVWFAPSGTTVRVHAAPPDLAFGRLS